MRMQMRKHWYRLVAVALLGLAAPARCLAESPAVVDGYTQISSYTLPDYGWVPRTPLKEPAYASAQPRYALMVLGGGRKTVVTLVWDESAGTGSGYDTMYVDANLNRDLTDPAEKFFYANAPKRHPSEQYLVKGIREADGEGVFDLGMETNGEQQDVISYAAGYGWKDVLGLHHLPGNSSIQWGKSLQDAPVHCLGTELVPVPSPPAGVAPPVAPVCTLPQGTAVEAPSKDAPILPGSSLGTVTAGSILHIGWRLASFGSKPPATELRCSAGGGQSYLRVLKPDGGIVRDIPMAGGCSCAEGFSQTVRVPSDVPPGRHLVVFRLPRRAEQGGPADFLYPITVENPGFGKAVPDPAAELLAGLIKDKGCTVVSLRRAIEPGQLMRLAPSENPQAALVVDTHFDCFFREGFIDNRDKNSGAGEALRLGSREMAADVNRGLIRFDLSGIPADAVIMGAVLRCTVAEGLSAWDGNSVSRGPFTGTIGAYALRRPWNELPAADGYACQLGPRMVVEKGKAGGELWGKPGAQDTETDRFADPAATAVEAQNVAAFDLTATVQQWHAGKLPNHGLLLQLEGDDKAALDLISSESPDLVRRPTLMVAYKGGPAQSVFTVPAGEDIQASSVAAKSSGKTLLVIVVSPACRLSESFLGSLGTPEVKAALGDRFVVQRLDAANWPGLTADYGITSVPAVVVAKPDGSVKGRAQGRDLMEVKKFLAFLANEAE